ncbi:MAG: hypothetical protein KFW21_05200 [Spirochaetota bacterium]|nr:hypothetical protein [Spirochaetota bacterium]
MKETLFATVNNQQILGEAILNCRKRILSEQPEKPNFAQDPNDNNNSFLNAEALQKLIDMHSLVSLAKFEGITVEDEEISDTIYKLRSAYEDEIEWELSLDDLGITNSNIRETFYFDMMVDRLIKSHLQHFDDPNDDSAEEFYYQNQESMKIPDSYTFIEIEVPNTDRLKLAVTIVSQNDTASIVKEAEKYALPISVNEEIPKHKLPESLQEMLADLEENKIGTIPAEDDTIVLIKLLRKYTGEVLTLEKSLPGLVEYLKFQQYKNLLDDLTIEAIEKCDIVYHNPELLKKLI